MYKEYTAILDIGSSKIICLVATKDHLSNPVICGIGHQATKGIGRGGIITDVKLLEEKIVAAISAAEKSAGINIEEVFLNFSGGTLTSVAKEINLDISGGEVSEKDILRIQEIAFDKYNNKEKEVIQITPVNYQIDNINGISNPQFMCGKKLKATLNLVIAEKTSFDNLLNCLSHCHINIKGIIPSAYASGLSCLSFEEMQNGGNIN